MNDRHDLDLEPDVAFSRRLEAALLDRLFSAERSSQHLVGSDDEPIRLEDLMTTQLESRPDTHPRRRGRVVAIAAAVVLLVAGGALVLSRADSGETVPAGSSDVTFEVQWPNLTDSSASRCSGRARYVSAVNGSCLRAFSGEAEFTGDITGTSLWDMVANVGQGADPEDRTVEVPAAFNATYLVRGTVAGCGTGEFMLAEVTKFVGWGAGQFVGTWQIMPGSGRGDLENISGSGDVVGEPDTTDAGTSRTHTGVIDCG